MTPDEEMSITRNTYSLVRQLDQPAFYVLLDCLLSNGLLNENSYEEFIDPAARRANNVRKLLTLMKSNPKANSFQLFCDALQTAGFSDVQELLCSSLPPDDLGAAGSSREVGLYLTIRNTKVKLIVHDGLNS